MSYINILPKDVLFIIISKLQNKDSIEIFSTVYEVYKLFNDIITWKLLFKVKDISMYNKLNTLNLNIDEYKMCYYLFLIDRSGRLTDAYLLIKDINLSSLGSRSNNKFTWDEIYKFLAVNKDTKIVNMPGKPVPPNFASIAQVRMFNTISFYIGELYDLMIRESRLIYINALILSYQMNYDIYDKLTLIILTSNELGRVIRLLESHPENFLKGLNTFSLQENLEDVLLILSDLKTRL